MYALLVFISAFVCVCVCLHIVQSLSVTKLTYFLCHSNLIITVPHTARDITG